jgi:hypothetical protein
LPTFPRLAKAGRQKADEVRVAKRFSRQTRTDDRRQAGSYEVANGSRPVRRSAGRRSGLLQRAMPTERSQGKRTAGSTRKPTRSGSPPTRRTAMPRCSAGLLRRARKR